MPPLSVTNDFGRASFPFVLISVLRTRVFMGPTHCLVATSIHVEGFLLT